MPHTFRISSRSALDCGAYPLVRASATDALRQRNQLDPATCKPARGPAADQGVRPTIYADRPCEKYAALSTFSTLVLACRQARARVPARRLRVRATTRRS